MQETYKCSKETYSRYVPNVLFSQNRGVNAPGSPAIIPTFMVFNLYVFIPLFVFSLLSLSLLRAVVVAQIRGQINSPPPPASPLLLILVSVPCMFYRENASVLFLPSPTRAELPTNKVYM